ncbi:MAG: hypothetical protein JSV34_05085 [Candidatus Omnitrophota bacterium]|nr:MAG: hypothetical protein JSV34_05085 [Candidatus Omnitrophota bacterium]
MRTKIRRIPIIRSFKWILVFGIWCLVFSLFSIFAQEQEQEQEVEKIQMSEQQIQENLQIQENQGIEQAQLSQEQEAPETWEQKKEKLAQPKGEKIPVIIDGDELNYLHGEGRVIAKGNVRVTHKNMELFCDEIDYDANTYLAHLKGDVKIVKTEIIMNEDKKEEEEKISTLYGQDVIFNFETNDAKMVNVRLEDPPVYGEAKKADKISDQKYIFKKKSHVTTCELKKPHYKLTARRITVYPEERIVARNVIFKVLDLPLAYFPYFVQSLKDEHFPVQVVPGKDRDLGGYFVLNSIRYDLNEDNRGKLHVDWYDKRKLGLGLSHKSDYGPLGEALFKYYAIQDEAYDLELREDMFKRYPERRGTADKYLEDDRYKWQFSHEFSPLENLSIKSEFNKFSDENFMKDFFFREYDVEPHPLSYNLIDYAFSHSSVSVLTQKRANHFYSESEYLPQLEYNFFQQNLGESNFYLESQAALGNLTSKTAHSDEDSDVVRLYSHGTLNYDNRIRWLSVNPYVGGYANIYSKNSFGEEGVWRGAFETGTDLSTKLYKIFAADFNMLGKEIKLMRHVVTPNVTYTYRHDPNISDSNILSFDGKDSISRTESVVFTLGNKLQAKTDEDKVWDFLYFSPSINYIIHPEGDSSRFTTVNTSLEVYPTDGISLNASKVYTVSDRRITSVNVDLSIADTSEEQKYGISIGHRYTRHSSTQGTFSLDWQVLPKVHFRNYLRYEYNTEDMLERMFGLKIDLHCWWLDLGVRIDKQRAGVNNHSFWMIFSLKAFPDMEVEFDETYRGAKRRY